VDDLGLHRRIHGLSRGQRFPSLQGLYRILRLFEANPCSLSIEFDGSDLLAPLQEQNDLVLKSRIHGFFRGQRLTPLQGLDRLFGHCQPGSGHIPVTFDRLDLAPLGQ
jgi:hypothetical protein